MLIGNKLSFFGNNKPCTSFEWELSAGETAQITRIKSFQGETSIIDWGDGTYEKDISDSSNIPHTYNDAGTYKVRISDNAEWIQISYANVTKAISWGNRVENVSDCYYNCIKLSGELPEWGKNITNTKECYYNCKNFNCTKLPKWTDNITYVRGTYFFANLSHISVLPEWGPNITDCCYCYRYSQLKVNKIPEWSSKIINCARCYWDCFNISCEQIPEWSENLQDVAGCYYNCKKLKGHIPEWTEKITDATSTFWRNYELTGNIPKWGKNITGVAGTYSYCRNLTGNIPEWPKKFYTTYAGGWGNSGTYEYCTSLTGNIPPWPNCDELTSINQCYYNCNNLSGNIPPWPPKVKDCSFSFFNCYNLTGEIPTYVSSITSLKSTFVRCSKLSGYIQEWPTENTTCFETYYECSNLSGVIPKWPVSLINTTQRCYVNCINLTGIWDENATDKEIMPEKVTFPSDTVHGANENLRKYFYPNWGGTKPVPTSQSYVQDGLVCQFDGIDNVGYGQHDNNTSIWKDLKTGINLNLYNVDILQDSVNFKNLTNSYGSMPNETFNNFSDYTIEICIDPTEWKNNVHCVVAFKNKFGIGFVRGDFIVIPDRQVGSKIYVTNKTLPAKYFSIKYKNTETSVKQNNINIIDSGRDGFYAGSTNTLFVGTNASDVVGQKRPFFGKIYSIRIYNRLLTDEEQTKNYNIDRNRFGI